ncbi:uncharacterized protein LOC129590926 [Paramacrobiotus metropolitanus]|uniref:uncharacterized protein LOC129590926 n=1 Tax=Paramacrobiotus metropolitanus TaxID=2943436 RepID=UPI002445C7DB|nr:uncharacterized protein LOC129590926 [Paramacrobiotus metropolitanus]
MDCRLVNPGFRRLWVGAEGISYQNTVAVRVHTAGTAGQEECWLGYIQDIRDEHVLVDFASSRPGAAARYIHASHVWPLPFLSPDPDRPYTSVFAALRDRYDEPFRFRPATALHFDWECKMCFINLSAAGADAAAAPAAGNANAMAVVDWCQIMSELPFGQPPLLARTTGLLYTRHEILLNMNIHATAQCVFNIRTAADACQLLDSFRQGYRVQPAAALAGRGPGPGPATEADEAAMEESCRFHLRIGPDPQRCTFIVAGNQTDTASMDRTAAALHKILEQYAACRAGRLSSHTTTTSSHQTLHNERFALSAGASVLHQIIFILTSVIQFLYSGRQKEVDKARLAEHWPADFNFFSSSIVRTILYKSYEYTYGTCAYLYAYLYST